MIDFFKLNEKLLRQNFQKEVLDEMAGEPFMSDPAFVDTMFHSYVTEEENSSQIRPGPYQSVTQGLSTTSDPTPNPDFQGEMSEIDLSGVQAKVDEGFQHKLEVPETYQPPRGEAPTIPTLSYPRLGQVDERWRQGPAPQYFPADHNMSAYEV